MKNVVITGASSGIGFACAELFSEKEFKVYNLDIKESDNKKVTTIICDVTKEKDVIVSISKIPTIDILINCAGIFGCYYIENTPEEFLNKIIDVNMKGNFLVTKYAFPKSRKSKGNIVFISSGIGVNADPTCPAYCMTKAGINMFVKDLTLTKIKNGIRVNAVLPGPIETPLLMEWFNSQDELNEYASLNPQNLIGSPKDVANAIYFLSNNENRYINGSFLAVDGGESISTILPSKIEFKSGK